MMEIFNEKSVIETIDIPEMFNAKSGAETGDKHA
jgi:hypothetical protein